MDIFDYRHDQDIINEALERSFMESRNIRPKLQGKAVWKDETTPLRALRLETLGPEVLLGLYAGEISILEIA